MNSFGYETFIRRAFSIDRENMINRGEDPASLADADKFREDDLESVKAAVGYSIGVINNHIRNNVPGVSLQDTQEMNRILRDVINSENLVSINSLIEDYRILEDRYIIYIWQ